MPLLSEEREELFREFLRQTEEDLLNVIEEKRSRLGGWEKLIKRYQSAQRKVLNDSISFLKQFHEAHNEICTAVVLLEDSTLPNDTNIDYELDIKGCNKKIDFIVTAANSPIRYVEVKTIHPITQDDWIKYKAALEQNRFTENTRLILDQEWLGGELYHNYISSRSKFLEYCMDFEEKIEACLTNKLNKITFLLLFSNGFDWHIDTLEDFEFFYSHRRHAPDDHFAKMEEYHIKINEINLKRNINYFAYAERPNLEIRPKRNIIWNVTYPDTPWETH